MKNAFNHTDTDTIYYMQSLDGTIIISQDNNNLANSSIFFFKNILTKHKFEGLLYQKNIFNLSAQHSAVMKHNDCHEFLIGAKNSIFGIFIDKNESIIFEDVNAKFEVKGFVDEGNIQGNTTEKENEKVKAQLKPFEEVNEFNKKAKKEEWIGCMEKNETPIDEFNCEGILVQMFPQKFFHTQEKKAYHQ